MAKLAWKRGVIGNSKERKMAPISWGKEQNRDLWDEWDMWDGEELSQKSHSSHKS
jgi:hypothetical protein